MRTFCNVTQLKIAFDPVLADFDPVLESGQFFSFIHEKKNERCKFFFLKAQINANRL
jgi:hypothetical protein